MISVFSCPWSRRLFLEQSWHFHRWRQPLALVKVLQISAPNLRSYLPTPKVVRLRRRESQCMTSRVYSRNFLAEQQCSDAVSAHPWLFILTPCGFRRFEASEQSSVVTATKKKRWRLRRCPSKPSAAPPMPIEPLHARHRLHFICICHSKMHHSTPLLLLGATSRDGRCQAMMCPDARERARNWLSTSCFAQRIACGS